MQLRFVTSESAFDYFRVTRAYLEQHGKPVAFYSDKHGIFRVNSKDAVGGDGITQFGRALVALNIDIICANSPQAKGRVERAFGTLQDRLVKELRLAGVSSIAAANDWLPGFITGHNRRFGRDPTNAKDLHRPLTRADDLDEILAWREERTVTQNLTLHYDRMMLLLDPTPLVRGLVRKKVVVVNYPDGRFAVQFNGMALGFKLFDKIRTVQPGAIVDNKRLSAVLEQVQAQQAAYPACQQRGHARGSGRQITWRRRGCRRRAGRRATGLRRFRPELPLSIAWLLHQCWGRTTASRAALRAPASRPRPLTPLPASSSWLTCRVALTLSAAARCYFYFARSVTFLSCADTGRALPQRLQVIRMNHEGNSLNGPSRASAPVGSGASP